MKRTNLLVRLIATATLCCAIYPCSALAQTHFAATVIDYHPGQGVTLPNPYAAVGKPGDIVGAGSGFDGVYSPFNSHYEASELTQIGEGGDLTLRLDRSVQVVAGQLELGIYTNVGLIDNDYPNGINGGGFGADAVLIAVSQDGISWTTLGTHHCDFPASAFTDSPSPFHPTVDGLTASDFGKPHSLQLSDLDGMNHAQILTALNGSAGGTWIDLSGSGLSSVSYVRFRLDEDADLEVRTFELAGISINTAAAGNSPGGLNFTEDFATNPIGTRASSDTGHASYSTGELDVNFVPAAGATKRTSWPLAQTLTEQDSFSYSLDFSIEAINFSENNFGQLSFGLINSVTTGNNRTSSPSNAWDILTIDYFPNEQFATFTPTVIGSQQAGQTNAFDNLKFPSGSASLINDFDEIELLPVRTDLTASLNYEAASRTLTLRLKDQAINADSSNTDDDTSTIQYTIPAGIEFSVDSFAIICWQESSGGTANLKFTNLQVSTASPSANYYSWADTHIPVELDRATGMDANGDGLSNLMSYALGGEKPISTLSGNRLNLQWQELPARDDVQVHAETSSDLRRWTPIDNSILSTPPGLELHQATLNISGDREFLRLDASRP